MIHVSKIIRNNFYPAETSSASSFHDQKKLLQIWKIFFDFQYFLLCCPFRIKLLKPRNSKFDNLVVATSWLPQRILCVVSTFLSFFWMIAFLRGKIPTQHNKPSQYLQLAVEINIILQKLALMKIYWLDKSGLLKILNYIIDEDVTIPIPRGSRLFNKLLMHFWCMIYLVLFLVVKVFITIIKNENERGTGFWVKTFNLGRNIFFMTKSGQLSLNQSLSAVESIIPTVTVASEFTQQMFYSYLTLAAFLPVFTLWTVVKTFVCSVIAANLGSEMNVESYKRLELVKKQYEGMKHLTNLINKVYGLSFSSFLLKIIFYYATRFNVLFNVSLGDSYKVVNLLYLIMNSLSTAATFMLAGDACHQVKS